MRELGSLQVIWSHTTFRRHMRKRISTALAMNSGESSVNSFKVNLGGKIEGFGV
jgi:hypothetical protein